MGWELIKKLVIQHRADIEVGTVKRTPDMVLTYNQNLKKNDKRVLLDENGHKSAVRREYAPPSSTSMSALGYIDGNGKVALGSSTVHQSNHRELVLRKPSDRKINEEEEQNATRWFQAVKDIHSDADYKDIMHLYAARDPLL